jgi:hypothetical protein
MVCESMGMGEHMVVISSAPLYATRIHCKRAFNDGELTEI